MKTCRIVFPVLLVCALAAPAAAGVAPPTHINYQGVLRNASGHPLDGLFDMVFYFFSADVGGDEILIDTLPAVPVSGGLFSVQLGRLGIGTVTDGSGPGIFAYLPNVFAQYDNVHLEIWVDGEMLQPRMPISSVPTALSARFVNGMNVASRGPSDRYVDAVSGNDDNNGIFPHTPKQTISSALAGIPAIIDGDVTVHIADGIYNEEVSLWKHVRVGPGSGVHLLGNEAAPQNVVIDGTGLFDTSGLFIRDQDVRISGLTVTNFEQGIILATGGTWTEIENCRLVNNQIGLLVLLGSVAEISDTLITGNTESGIEALQGVATLGAGTEVSNNVGNGVLAQFHGTVFFDPPCSFLNNGLSASEHSTIQGYSVCTLTSSACVAADPSARCVP